MQSDNSAVSGEIVLAGGGHAHALLIRKWGMDPLPGARLTLVSPQPVTPYSGMLPGLIAGHYASDEIHIDLARLCQWAGVRFIQTEVTGIDPGSRHVLLREGDPLDYDVLSIDTGSVPVQSVPGVAEHAVPVKPIAGFWQHWRSVLATLRESRETRHIAVVGGGAGSVEIILAMARACSHANDLPFQPEFHLVFQTESLLPGYPGKVRKAAEKACDQLGIQCHNNFSVNKVGNSRLSGDTGRELACDQVFWCTQAGAPDWPAGSGLDCDEGGFIRVNTCLQSLNHPEIFAAGDIACMVDNPRPKAGVYAVRQAPVLFANLRRVLQNKPLESYRPQDRFLSLLALGGKTAAGSRGILSFTGKWVWRWKDRIDRKFMGHFRDLPAVSGKTDAHP